MANSYKIFINGTSLVIAEMDFSDDGQYHKFPEVKLIKDIPAFIRRIYEGHYEKGILIKVNSVEDTFEVLCNQFPVIVAAGGLVSNTRGELLMIFRRGKWDLPKGKLDPGEELENTALREVGEETGVKGLHLEEKSSVMYYVFKDHGKLFLKEIHWYKMSCDSNAALIPQAKEEITLAEWVKPNEIPEKLMNTYESIRELLLRR